MKRVAVLLAPGFEEVEALAPVDILRRAGFDVTMVGVMSEGTVVTGSHQIVVTIDARLEDVSQETFDAIVLPGGMPGAKHLKESAEVLDFVRRHDKAGARLNAICAAPIVLNAAGVLADKDFTCYPGFEAEITTGHHTGAFVEHADRLITGCGPAAAFEFAYAIVDALGGDSATLRTAMQYDRLH